MPNRAVVSSHQFDILLHCGAGPRGFRLSIGVWRLQPQDCCFLLQAGTQGLDLKPSRPRWIAYSSLGQCFSRAKNTAKGTEQEHRGVPAASLYHSQRWRSPWVWKPRHPEPPHQLSGKVWDLPRGYWESQLSTVCRVGQRLTLALLLFARLTV